MRYRGVVAVAALVFLLVGSGAQAGKPGVWTRITEPTGRNIDEVGFVRTPGDGVLHVVWAQDIPGQPAALWHVGIRPNGIPVGAKNAAVGNFDTIGNPDLVVSADGSLRVFFGGLGTAPNNSLNTATAPPTGVGWTLQPGKAAQDTSAYASPSGAGTTKNGTPVSAWGTTFGTRAHFGTDPTDPDVTVQTDCCGYYPDVAPADAANQAVVAWFSNAKGAAGLFAQTISASGPVGAKVFLPGSATGDSSIAPDQRIGITARVGGGAYVAYGAGYPTFKSVNLWRFGSAKPVFSIPAEGAQDVNIAAAPAGRLWLMWHQDASIYATRTNRAATRVGAPVLVKPPPGTDTVWKVSGEGSVGPLDLLANVSSPGSTATWHTQVLPRLSLTATGGKILRFRVTDAGDPVAGAKVRIGSRTLTTDSAGRAQVDLPKGKLSATATATGYSASAAVRVTSS
jgi:hypothetical protein